MCGSATRLQNLAAYIVSFDPWSTNLAINLSEVFVPNSD